MNKTLVFDMDGTIADLYGVDGWLEMLRNEDATPYRVARPLYDMRVLTAMLTILQAKGWRVVVTTWLAKGSSKRYDALVREAKLEWLDEMNFPYDEIHLVKYGTTKANCTRHHGGFQILIDDNDKVRNGWTLGRTIDANNNILDELASLI
jgi:FMN phosphatase YigB (HAD superfamily)